MGSPGAAVELTVPLRYSGAWRAWKVRGEADASGAWALQGPVWTGGAGAVPSAPSATLRVGGQQASLGIPEGAVRAGARLQAPELNSPD